MAERNQHYKTEGGRGYKNEGGGTNGGQNVGRGGPVVRTLDPQSREPGFESSCCHIEALAISFTPRCHSSLSCINEYLAIERGGHMNE